MFLRNNSGSYELYNEGFDYEYSGDLKKAIEFYEKARKEAPSNPTILYEMAGVYRKMGSIEKAEELYKRNIKENPLYPHTYSALGSLFYPDGPCDKIRCFYLIAITIYQTIDSNRSSKKIPLLKKRVDECSK